MAHSMDDWSRGFPFILSRPVLATALISPFAANRNPGCGCCEQWDDCLRFGTHTAACDAHSSKRLGHLHCNSGLVSRIRSAQELSFDDGKPAPVRPRLGQGAFRIIVTDLYGRKCAVTGEKTMPALEAAHIRPYADGAETLKTMVFSCAAIFIACLTRAM